MNRVHAQDGTFNPLRDGIALAASVIGPLVLYVLTMPRTVVLEDDGLFLMAGAHLGVAHPPGYPLYTLIVYLFTQLPFGSVAFLGHLSSAVLGALTCGCVYVCARLLGASPTPARTAAWLFAASEHFWSQAIIAEVYTLNTLFFFGLYALLLYGLRQPHRTGIWIAAAGVYGLSLTNHWPLMVLSTPGLMLLVFPIWRTVYRKLPLLLGISLPCAALPYAWMVWRSHQDPLINFYGSIDTLKEFWHYFSRQGYAHIDASPSAGWSDRFGFMQWLGNEFFWQLTLPGFALAVFGLIVLFQRRQIAKAGSGLLVFLGNSIVLIALLGFDFDFFWGAIFRPYSLLCYGIAALWLGVGLQVVIDWLAERLPSKFTQRPRLKIGMAALVGTAMVAWSVHEHWRPNDRSDSDFAEHYADMQLDILPEDAVLFVFGDATGPMGYYQYIENRRPDVALYNLQGLVYGKRLYDPFLPKENKKEVLEKFTDSTERALFFPMDFDIFPNRRGRIYGFLMEVVKDGKPGTIEIKRHPRGEEYFIYLVHLQPIDRWERVRRNGLLFQYGRYLGLIYFSGDSGLLNSMQELFRLAEGSYACLIGMAGTLIEHGNNSHWEQVSAWLERAETLKYEALKKQTLARLYYLKGSLLQKQGKRVEAVASFAKSRDIYPHPGNKALEALEQYKVNFKRVNPPRRENPKPVLPFPP
ncbi:MAG: DUF2723 domain-containing protein [Gemmatimonadetes bacterium]|nr:DUF2723 domain-containing protein [Gemmatimonadota bacterium]MYK53813.1 DUF2723 domain-containing protein [Gemmatimonadota bacterium]